MQSAVSSRIQFVDLRRQTAAIRGDLDRAIANVLDACDFILGEEVDRFEADFANYCGVPYAIGVDSGFSALELALRAIGVGPGDEVVTQANTFIATVSAVESTGARPILVDCSPDGSVDTARMLAAITPRTRALIPVHLFGRVTALDELVAEAELRDVAVIEDACQAHGARAGERRAGSWGVASAFSFYPGKNLGAFGDGGGIVTRSAEVQARCIALRSYGQRVKYQHEVSPAINRRLDTIQAAVLRIKLRHLDEWNQARIRLAARYREQLAGVPVGLPATGPDGSHVYHLFVIETPERDGLRQALADGGIDTGIHYPIPTHLQPALAGLGYAEGDFPVTERLARESLSLPMYPELAQGDVDRVADAIREFFAGRN